VRSSTDGLSRGHGFVLLPLGGGDGNGGLLLVDEEVGGAARYGQ
jgi:hypothetical protein